MKTNTNILSRLSAGIVTLVIMATMALPAFADERQIYSNEQLETKAGTLILDFDDDDTNIVFQFGDALGEQILWDGTDLRFEFTDDVQIQGSLNVQGDVDIDLNQLVEARIENLAVAPTCNVAAAGRIYYNTTDDNSYVCDGVSTWNQIDSDLTGLSGTTDETFTIDTDDTGGDLSYVFGATIDERLTWDDADDLGAGTAGQFVFTDDLNIQGDLDIDGVLTAGSGNTVLTNAVGLLDGEQIQDDTIDDDSLDFGTGVDQISGADLPLVDNFDNSNNTDVQLVMEDVDSAIGVRSAYTEQNVITNNEAVATSLNLVDQAIGDQTYTSDFVVTDGEDLSDSLDAIDLAFGSRLFTNDNVVADGQTVTASVDALDTALGNQDYTDSLILTDDQTTTASLEALNVASGNQTYTNDNVLTDGQSFTASLDVLDTTLGNQDYTDALILTDDQTTTASLEALNVASGNQTYTDDNFVVDGQSFTASIDALDQAIAANGLNDEQTLFVSMNDLTIQEDGTANKVNVYTDSETGANPHQFYTVRTNRVAQQDLDLKFKVKLPEDFVDFSGTNDLSFFYQTDTGVAADNKLDILVEDDNGDDAFAAAAGQGLVNVAWTEYTDEFDGAGFDPVAGEYIYVTVKGYATSGNDARAGEIVIRYSTQ